MPLDIQAIVCAVDFSPFSPLVVSHGIRVAQRAGVPLYLIHAVHDPQDSVHPTAVFERGGDLTNHTHEARRKFDDLMAHTDIEWEAVVRFGDPVEQMVTFVDSLPPCLVVSASHGVSGFRRLFIGTVVERLTRKLARPMLVVKPSEEASHGQPEAFRTAVISCDGHGHWQRLAGLLNLLQTDAESNIHLVYALEGPLTDTPVNDAASYGQSQQTQIDRLGRQLSEQARSHFPYAGAVSVTVQPGVPQEMALRVCRERASELITVGVRRSAKVGRWISGSTTETLLRHSPCCVLTVPEPEASKRTGRNRP